MHAPRRRSRRRAAAHAAAARAPRSAHGLCLCSRSAVIFAEGVVDDNPGALTPRDCCTPITGGGVRNAYEMTFFGVVFIPFAAPSFVFTKRRAAIQVR